MNINKVDNNIGETGGCCQVSYIFNFRIKSINVGKIKIYPGDS